MRDRLKILVVDDDADTAESLAALLTLRSHEARTAYGAERALELVKDFDPDAVVLDLDMPRADGYAAAAELHRLFPIKAQRPRLIAFTARSAPTDIRAAKQAGFDLHVCKSTNVEHLLDSIESDVSPDADA